MRRVQSGEGVTDLGSVEKNSGADLMGRGHPKDDGRPWVEPGTTPPKVVESMHQSLRETVPGGLTEAQEEHIEEQRRRQIAYGASEEIAQMRADEMRRRYPMIPIKSDDPILQPPIRITYGFAADCIADYAALLFGGDESEEFANGWEQKLFDAGFVVVRRA